MFHHEHIEPFDYYAFSFLMPQEDVGMSECEITVEHTSLNDGEVQCNVWGRAGRRTNFRGLIDVLTVSIKEGEDIKRRIIEELSGRDDFMAQLGGLIQFTAQQDDSNKKKKNG